MPCCARAHVAQYSYLMHVCIATDPTVFRYRVLIRNECYPLGLVHTPLAEYSK